MFRYIPSRAHVISFLPNLLGVCGLNCCPKILAPIRGTCRNEPPRVSRRGDCRYSRVSDADVRRQRGGGGEAVEKYAVRLGARFRALEDLRDNESQQQLRACRSVHAADRRTDPPNGNGAGRRRRSVASKARTDSESRREGRPSSRAPCLARGIRAGDQQKRPDSPCRGKLSAPETATFPNFSHARWSPSRQPRDPSPRRTR